MIYAVKILLVCCANYVKSYICKVIFMLPDINLLDFEESVITYLFVMVAMPSIKQKLFKFLFHKDAAIKIQFYKSFCCRIFPT